MASPPNSPQTHQDLRSTSLSRLRLAFQRAKYGGTPPDTVGFPHTTAIPGLSFTPKRGFHIPLGSHSDPPKKPTRVLSKAQKYRIAQHSVGSLIGKRMNRNNQRTRERDPWNYYGARRRWAKQEVTGTWAETPEGMEDYWGEEMEEAGIEDDYTLGELPQDGAWEADLGAVDIWGRADVDAGQLVVRGRKSWRVGRRGRSEGGWEMVRRPEMGKNEEEEEDDQWDMISVSSAPG